MKTFTKVILVLFLLSTNYSLNAQWVPTNFSGGNVISFAATNSNIFAQPGTTSGIFKSTDYGMNWSSLTFSATVMKSYNNDIYASTYMMMGYGGGVYRSTNEGVNWTLIGFNNHSVSALEVTSTNIFVYTDTGFYRSNNIGASWTKIPLVDNNIRSITSSGLNIYAGSLGVIYRSTNNGVNWSSFNNGLPSNIRFNLITISGSNMFVAGLNSSATPDSGVYKSSDNGQSWINVGLRDKRVTALFTSGYNLFAGTDLGGVYLSTNAGLTWLQKNQGLTSNDVTAIYVFGDYIFAGGGGTPGIWRRFLLDIISVKNISSEIPEKYSLSQNFPNPFNPSTTIKYQITKNETVSLKVFDILGIEVATLVNEKQSPGTYQVNWSAGNLSSGIYFYRLRAGSFTDTKRMTLVK
ncbi:MAG: T9SS type A sorting domain-containing protein [Ignavibacteria bacterium]|nr:T9SS type A sorting domain-containing protein [Ignavibacteria bacterium]